MINKKLKSWLQAIFIMLMILSALGLLVEFCKWVVYSGNTVYLFGFIGVAAIVRVTWMIQINISKKGE